MVYLHQSLKKVKLTKLLDSIFAHSENNPEAIALAGPNVEMTYFELRHEVIRVTKWLRGMGVKRGDLALLRLSAEVEAIVMLALMHIGAGSAQYSDSVARLEFYSAGYQFLITTEKGFDVDGLTTLRISGEALEKAEDLPTEVDATNFENDSIARVIYSSGTTGLPKGVPLTALQIESRVHSFSKHIICNHTFISLLGFDVSLGLITLFADLLYGRKHHIVSTPEQLRDALKSESITAVAMSPLTLQRLLGSSYLGEFANSSIRQIYSAGGPLPLGVWAHASKALNVTVASIYGSTEVGLVAIQETMPSHESNCGQVFDHVELEIVDELNNNLNHGVEGVVRFRLPWLGQGYLGDSEATISHFRDGFFYPGDRGKIKNGMLFITGRTNLIFNLNGVKIDPLALEAKASELSRSEAYSCQVGSGKIALVSIAAPPLGPEAIRELERVFGLAGLIEAHRIETMPRNTMGKPNRTLLADAIRAKGA